MTRISRRRIIGPMAMICGTAAVAVTLSGATTHRSSDAPPLEQGSVVEIAQQATTLVDSAIWTRILDVGFLIGNAEASGRIVVFGDFQCPPCARLQASLIPILADNAADLALMFMPLPMAHHAMAIPAARAAECADHQERFADVARLLFAKQDSLATKSLRSFAQDARVPDLDAFDRCVGDRSESARIRESIALARALKLQGTPTIIINRRILGSGVKSDSTLRAEVHRALTEGRGGR